MVLDLNINCRPRMLALLVDLGVFRRERFALIDVGCSGGIHPAWRLFRDQLEAYGFDPQKPECARLSDQEDNPNVKYFPYWIGLDDGHEFLKRKKAQHSEISLYFNPWSRLSCIHAARLRSQTKPEPPVSGEARQSPADQRISISKFVRDVGIGNIDMIKIDTDGNDLESAISCQDAIDKCNVLGFMIEAGYVGSFHDTENNFANIDKWMRRNGFSLFAMSVNCYSRADLPLQFEYRMLAQTVSGQPIWGDLVYFRDAGSPEYTKIWSRELSTLKLLKLACLFELFSLPDCAAELINKYSRGISEIVNPGKLLDLLTPRLHGETLSYEQYTRRFREDVNSFFPSPFKELRRKLATSLSWPSVLPIQARRRRHPLKL